MRFVSFIKSYTEQTIDENRTDFEKFVILSLGLVDLFYYTYLL